MSDIFLSCATDDGVTAAKLAAVFRQQGWDVWWDASTITPGANYIEAVAEELEHSKVVVVLWSRAARKSSIVHKAVKHKGRTLPVLVLLEKIDPPIWLSMLPSFDLMNWDGTATHAGLQSLVRNVRGIIGAASCPVEPPLSIETLSLAEIMENARVGIQKSAAALTKAEARFKGVFISYRRDEAKAHAKWFYDRLAAHFGKEKIFLDLENVGLGKNFVKAITSAAESCAVMIALIGRQWLRSADGQTEFDDFVRLEVATALRRNIDVIPILLPGASIPPSKDLPEDLSSLAHHNALPLSENRWERDVEDLIKTLESLLKG
jgi:hypothetical protein